MTTGGGSMPLWELTSEYLQLEALLEDALAADKALVQARVDDKVEGQDGAAARAVDGMREALEALGGALNNKVEGVCRIIRNREAGAEALAQEGKRLADRAQVAANGAQRLREYLYDQLDVLGEDTQRAETPVAKVVLSRRPDRKAIRIDDATALPPQFKKTTLQVPSALVPDDMHTYSKRTDVVMALVQAHAEEEGLPPPGASFVAPKRSLRIS